MTGIFKRLIRAYTDAKTTATYEPLWDSEDGWTEEDGKLLAVFFNSSSGQRLRHRITNYVVRCAVEATRQTENHAYHNGIARGVAMTVTAVESHFANLPRNASDIEVLPPSSVVGDFGIN